MDIFQRENLKSPGMSKGRNCFILGKPACSLEPTCSSLACYILCFSKLFEECAVDTACLPCARASLRVGKSLLKETLNDELVGEQCSHRFTSKRAGTTCRHPPALSCCHSAACPIRSAAHPCRTIDSEMILAQSLSLLLLASLY